MIAIAGMSLGANPATMVAASAAPTPSLPLRSLRVDCKSVPDVRSWVAFVGSTGETSEGHGGLIPFCSSSFHPLPQENHGLVPLSNSSFEPLSQEVAMGLVLQAAGGRGWKTDSGLEGPAFSSGDNLSGGISQLSKSPRRRMRIEFTCNACGERTMRVINPHAYTEGTVFVQCKGCNVFHKLVDNLNLFYEWDGRLFKTSSKSILPSDGEHYNGRLKPGY